MRELTQKEIVVIALYLLGGDKKSYDTEDVAVKASELAPGKFSWRKYRENIDQELVRRTITSAKLDSNYVVGSQKDGWMLTKTGVEFARKNIRLSWKKPTERKLDEGQLHLRREKERMIATDAYTIYVKDGLTGLNLISKKTADDFFRLNDYVKGNSRIKKISAIQNSFIDDEDLSPVIKIVASIALETKDVS